jgi:2-(1,2-epoxy-1,2-dihydrophenyl)acetyl-CoA isomerase
MAEQVEESQVVLELEGAVAWIRFNRPDKLNPIGSLARRQLDAALKQVERDDAVRCVVLIGSGRAFSAGADVSEMSSGRGVGRTEASTSTADRGDVPPHSGGGMRSPEDIGRVLREEYLVMLQRLRTMPKPVICGMNGLAAGIGASFALACDIRIAADDAYISEAFANLGLGPDGGVSWMLPRFIGRGRALEMFYTAERLSAQDAERFGIVNRVVPKESVETECRALAERLATASRAALAGAKRAVNFAEGSSFEEAAEFESFIQETCAAGDDFREGVTAFLEKRKPNFGGGGG